MSDFRAKDADRNRFVELIEAAHADGQLGVEDRDLRVSRVRAAETLDELRGLTRDLRETTAPVVPRPPASGAARSSAQRQARTGMVIAVVAIALVGLLGLGVASTWLVGFSSSVTESSSVDEVASETAVPFDGDVQGTPFEMLPGQVRMFLQLYEAEFGTLDSYSVVFYPTRVIVQVPVQGVGSRYERWSYDGTWQRHSEASVVTGPAEILDLGALGVTRLIANITTAKETLRVPRGQLGRVAVHRWRGEDPSVTIYIGNDSTASGLLKTTLAGTRIVRSVPYEP